MNMKDEQQSIIEHQSGTNCGSLSPTTPVELRNDIRELGDGIQRDIKDGTCFRDQDKLQAFVASLNQLEIKTLQCWAANQETSK